MTPHISLLSACAMLLATPVTATIHLRPELIQTGSVWTYPSVVHGALKGRRWLPDGQAKALLIAVHGTQTHSGWFGALAVEMNHHGWAVYAPDREGSGLNINLDHQRRPRPADVSDWTDWMRWLDAVVGQVVREREAGGSRSPVYLLGSSWGAALVTAYMSRDAKFQDGSAPSHSSSIGGVILSVPSGLKSKVPGMAKKVEATLIGVPLGLLGNVCPPLRRIGTGIGLPAEAYSTAAHTRTLIGNKDIRVPEVESALRLGDQDPRMIHRATYRFLLHSAFMRRAALRALKIDWQVPTLSLLAETDDIADNKVLKKILPPDSVVTVNHTEHAIQVERADSMAAEILRWHFKL